MHPRKRRVFKDTLTGLSKLLALATLLFLFASPFIFKVFAGLPPAFVDAVRQAAKVLPKLVAAIVCWLPIYHYIAWRRFSCDVGDAGIALQTGVLSTISTRVPLSRITHISVRRGILDLLFGLYNVHIHMPGDDAIAALRIEGVDKCGSATLVDTLVAAINRQDYAPDSGQKIDHGSLSRTMPVLRRSVIKKSFMDVLRVTALGVVCAIFASPFIVRVLAGLPKPTIDAFGRLSPLLPFLLPALAIFFCLYQYLYYRRYFYDIDAGSVIIRYGAFLQTRKVMPLSTIVGVAIERNLLDWLLGLHNVRILQLSEQSPHAGGRINGLDRTAASQVRDMLLELQSAEAHRRAEQPEENGNARGTQTSVGMTQLPADAE
jgi:membrane protein YdbS with pleckstrin-like domain